LKNEGQEKAARSTTTALGIFSCHPLFFKWWVVNVVIQLKFSNLKKIAKKVVDGRQVKRKITKKYFNY